MKIVGGDIYVTLTQVSDSCGLSVGSLWEMISRGSAHWQTIKDPEDLRRRLILYKVMLPKYRKLISNFYCQGLEPAEWLHVAAERSRSEDTGIVDTVKTAYHNHAAYLRYYATAQGADERKTQKTRKYLARAASCMAAIHIYYSQNNLNLSDRKPIKEVSEYLTEEKDILFPKGYSYMKCSVRHIHEALKQLASGTPVDEIITQPRMGNENRLGEDHAYIKAAVARMLVSGKNPAVADIVRKVQFLAAREEKRKPSESTIYNYVAEMRNITTLQRYGSDTKAAAALRFSIPTAKAMYSGDCWEMDGTRVQLQPFQNSELGTRNSQLSYLYIVAVRDVYSGAFLGWSFGVSESGLMYREALKMAVTLAGYLPYELRHDRFPGHNSDETERLFESLRDKGCKLTKTSVASGKVHLERAFGTLQGVFESDRHTWVGQGIKSSRNYARPTADYLARVHKSLKSDGFGWEDAWRQENEVVMTYNYTPLSIYSKRYRSIEQSPIELHDNDSERPNVIPVESWDISELFWATRKVSIRNYSVTVEVNRQQYTYMLTDEKYYNIVRNHSALLVRFDASDMSEVTLFDSLYGTFLNTVQKFEAPQLYGANPEYDKLAVERAKQKALKQRLNAELQETVAHCQDDILGISISHLIPKQNAELAETSAMAAYWRNTVPVPVETLHATSNPKPQRSKKPSASRRPEPVEGSPLDNILNQL